MSIKRWAFTINVYKTAKSKTGLKCLSLKCICSHKTHNSLNIWTEEGGGGTPCYRTPMACVTDVATYSLLQSDTLYTFLEGLLDAILTELTVKGVPPTHSTHWHGHPGRLESAAACFQQTG